MKDKNIKLKSQFYKDNHMSYFFAIVFMIIAAGLQVSIAFVLQNFLDVATYKDIDRFKEVFIGSAAILGSFAVFQGLENLFLNRFMKKAVSQYKGEVFSRILKKNINSFSKESTSTYISALNNDMTSIEQNYLLGFLKIILQGTLFMGGLASMAILNLKMFVITLGASSIPIIISSLLGNKLVNAEKQVSDHNAKFTALVNDLLSGFTIIKSFKADLEINKIFQGKNLELEGIKRKRRDVNSVIEVLNETAGNIVQIAVFASGVYFAIKGEITVGVVVAFVQLLNYVLMPISQMGPLIANRKAADTLIEKMDKIIYVEDKEENCELLESFNNEIVYNNVSFGYEEGVKNIHNVSLKFEKNKSYAIVGASGSGKSTLISFLLGYHDNYEGSITIDGRELNNISKDNLFDFVSVIQQNVFVFDTSIQDNITLFKEFDSEKITKAEEHAGLTQLIEAKGLDYKCGENGVNLSGGEKQRISIARSLIRDSSILLMDEATAALDNKTSYMVEESILGIDNLTKIIITHKMNKDMLMKYDEIIVMNNGMVEEVGTFDELMENKEYFYSLYTVNSK